MPPGIANDRCVLLSTKGLKIAKYGTYHGESGFVEEGNWGLFLISDDSSSNKRDEWYKT